jgi:xylulose-5-phosphate/fructose-6-phosphate phosphoketolase
MDAALRHCATGIGVWEWASSDQDGAPDVVIACAGDVPTMEALAAVMILRQHFPDLKIRLINVIDLMVLQADSQHPHGLNDSKFDALFTTNKPVIFAFHGYPSLIHQLTYRRANHRNFHVHGYKEEGTTTTPFDMAVLNAIDRFHLAEAVIKRVPKLKSRAAGVTEIIHNKLTEHHHYIREHGDDMPEIRHWKWLARAEGLSSP